MTESTRQRTILFLFLAMALLIVIGAALPSLDLKPGIPLTGDEGTQAALGGESLPPLTISVSSLFKAILGVLLALTVAYLLIRLILGTPWREIGGPLLAILCGALVLMGVIFALTRIKINLSPVEPEVLPPLPELPGEALGPVPPFLNWLAWIGLACLLAVSIFLVAAHNRKPRRPVNPLVLEVERAIEALKAGGRFQECDHPLLPADEPGGAG